jgi:hypothetical protein
MGAIEWCDKPPTREVVGYDHAATERDAMPIERCLRREQRGIEFEAARDVHTHDAGASQPAGPVWIAEIAAHCRVVDQARVAKPFGRRVAVQSR